MNSTQINRAFIKIAVIDILDVDELRKIFKRIRIDKERRCWLYNEDWSVYAIYKKQSLHRLMYHIFKGEIIGKSLICHHCDRPGCINPDHLYQGTAKSNYQDSARRGRRPWGTLIIPYDVSTLDSMKIKDGEKNLQTPTEFWGSKHANWPRK